MKEVRTIPALPRREPASNKGDFGRALIIGGSVGMAGAPMLAAEGALRSGAGLVELAVPWSVWLPASARLPAALVTPLEETTDGFADCPGKPMERLLQRADSAAIGPGLGTGEGPVRTLESFLAFGAVTTAVIDADGLNILAARRNEVRKGTVLTPHPGEMSRLTGRTTEEVQADRRGTAAAYAKERGVIVVLKGAGTIVTDGERFHENTTGSHGLARGGTGDVLSGVVAALLAQKMEPFDAAVLAAHAHGLAGDIAQDRIGAMGMTAESVVEALPEAWKRLEKR